MGSHSRATAAAVSTMHRTHVTVVSTLTGSIITTDRSRSNKGREHAGPIDAGPHGFVLGTGGSAEMGIGKIVHRPLLLVGEHAVPVLRSFERCGWRESGRIVDRTLLLLASHLRGCGTGAGEGAPRLPVHSNPDVGAAKDQYWMCQEPLPQTRVEMLRSHNDVNAHTDSQLYRGGEGEF